MSYQKTWAMRKRDKLMVFFEPTFETLLPSKQKSKSLPLFFFKSLPLNKSFSSFMYIKKCLFTLKKTHFNATLSSLSGNLFSYLIQCFLDIISILMEKKS